MAEYSDGWIIAGVQIFTEFWAFGDALNAGKEVGKPIGLTIHDR